MIIIPLIMSKFKLIYPIKTSVTTENTDPRLSI